VGLSLSIELPDGRTKRWGPDELAAADVPGGLNFGTSVPGGFKDLTCELLRRIDLDWDDNVLFATVKVLAPGNQIVWEGRAHAFPRSHGDSHTITPGAVGWNAHLKDDPSFAEIYVDRDLSGWTNQSNDRALVWVTAAYDIVGTPTLRPGNPAKLVSSWQGPWGSKQVVFGQYDSQHVPIGAVYYDIDPGVRVAADPGSPWTYRLELDANEDWTGATDSTGNLHSAGGSGYLTATGDRYYAEFDFVFDGTSTQAVVYDVSATFAVYGAHGLTRRGDDPGGVYASDVVEHVVSTAAPLLTYTTGDGGSIEPTTFVIPHLAFKDPGTAEDAILATNVFHLYEWGVWENREFFWRQPNPDRLCWEARLSDGARLDLEGDSADDIFNGVLVSYTDPNGRRRTAGPPGSGAHVEDAALQDTSDTNAANQVGIPAKWAKLDVSQVTTDAGAVQLGSIFLAEKALAQRQGSLVVAGAIQHPTKGKRPVYEVRAGDYVRVSDHPADVPRRILDTSYSHDTATVRCTLDNTSHRVDAVLERFGVVLTNVI
jgi:hypothetical protein